MAGPSGKGSLGQTQSSGPLYEPQKGHSTSGAKAHAQRRTGPRGTCRRVAQASPTAPCTTRDPLRLKRKGWCRLDRPLRHGAVTWQTRGGWASFWASPVVIRVSYCSRCEKRSVSTKANMCLTSLLPARSETGASSVATSVQEVHTLPRASLSPRGLGRTMRLMDVAARNSARLTTAPTHVGSNSLRVSKR